MVYFRESEETDEETTLVIDETILPAPEDSKEEMALDIEETVFPLPEDSNVRPPSEVAKTSTGGSGTRDPSADVGDSGKGKERMYLTARKSIKKPPPKREYESYSDRY